jgi:hypothetical protein
VDLPELFPRLTATHEERTSERVLGVGVAVSAIAATIAGATISLLLTDPVSITSAVDRGDITHLAFQLAGVIYDAMVGLLEYL